MRAPRKSEMLDVKKDNLGEEEPNQLSPFSISDRLFQGFATNL